MSKLAAPCFTFKGSQHWRWGRRPRHRVTPTTHTRRRLYCRTEETPFFVFILTGARGNDRPLRPSAPRPRHPRVRGQGELRPRPLVRRLPPPNENACPS